MKKSPAKKGNAALLLALAVVFSGCSTTPSPPRITKLDSSPAGKAPAASLPPAALFEKCRALKLVPTDNLLCVSVGEQQLRWYRRPDAGAAESFTLRETFVCSTSKYGIGQKRNSYRTPLGLHRVKEKIGDGMPLGTIFKSRRVVGYTWRDDPDASITTRILWLDGMEPGFNLGGEYAFNHDHGSAFGGSGVN